MILTFDQIKSITLGALDVIKNENGEVSFKRFTDKQLEYYIQNSEQVYNEQYYHHHRARNTVGVRFSFYTDATALNIGYKMLRGVTSNWFQLDLICDGAMISHTDIKTGDTCYSGTLSLSLPEGEHHITVHLPNMAIFSLTSLELEGASLMRAHTPTGPKILFLGDSITHGAFSPYPSLSYTARLTAMLDADALNQGIGGDIFRPGVIDKDLPFDPDIITIAFGTNDWSVARDNPSLRLSRADAYFDNLKKSFPAAKIVYISPTWRKLNSEEYSTFLPARKEFEALAKEKGISVIDGFTLVPQLDEFYADGLHPNPLGFSLYAENLASKLKKLGII